MRCLEAMRTAGLLRVGVRISDGFRLGQPIFSDACCSTGMEELYEARRDKRFVGSRVAGKPVFCLVASRKL